VVNDLYDGDAVCVAAVNVVDFAESGTGGKFLDALDDVITTDIATNQFVPVCPHDENEASPKGCPVMRITLVGARRVVLDVQM
jgi:hypothetical protein